MKLSELFKKKSEPVTTGNSVIDFYNNYDEEGRLMRKSRMPEYLTTMKYIEKYLTPGAKIIEIGAGTGRYSLALAEMGCDVTAVELVPHNIEIMKNPFLGKNGHIGIGTPDVAAAKAELEARGFTFREDTAKFKPDGTLNAIYLTEEICGFAIHLVGKKI